MDLTMGGAPVPVSALNCVDTLSILLLVPIFDGWVLRKIINNIYPILFRCNDFICSVIIICILILFYFAVC